MSGWLTRYSFICQPFDETVNSDSNRVSVKSLSFSVEAQYNLKGTTNIDRWVVQRVSS